MLVSKQSGTLPGHGLKNMGSYSAAFHSTGRNSVWLSSSTATDVFSSQDIVVGAATAFLLAFTASFLQGRRAQNDFVLWERTPSEILSNSNSTTTRTFNGEDWREMSRPDNYIFYNRRTNASPKKRQSGISRAEKTWVVIALLSLFVPIFSVEFFFALSRQVICDGGNPILRPDWAEYLCSPASLPSQ